MQGVSSKRSHIQVWQQVNETGTGHFGPKTVRIQDTSALVWWVRILWQ